MSILKEDILVTILSEAHNYQLQRFSKASDRVAFDKAIAIRKKVFVEEQNSSPEVEPDENDLNAVHWLVMNISGQVIATGRMFPDKANPKRVKIGRIAVLKEFRGCGIASLLMADILKAAVEADYEEAILGAQAYATRLYEKFGFKPEGEIFLDPDNKVEHILMRKTLTGLE